MISRLVLLLMLVMLAEALLLAWIADAIGWDVVLLLVIASGFFGVWLARREGLRAVQSFRNEIAAGQVPATPLLDRFLLIVAGGLFAVPGVLTDIAGLALLVPPVRTVVRLWLVGRLQAKIFAATRPRHAPDSAHDRIIDVRVIDAESRPPEGRDRQ